MDIKLKTFFTIIGIAIFSIMFLVLYEIFRLYQVTTALAFTEKQRYEMTLKADELRQSSDDLTKMARAYVITHDPHFKEDYYKILKIRNGEEPRPKDYEGIYWDLSPKIRKIMHPLQKPSSLESQMQKLPYSDFELKKLKESKINSDKLALLEQDAFAKSEKSKNLKLDTSIALLHSKEYFQAKENIMLPIDVFLTAVRKRTRQKIVDAHHKIDTIYKEIALLFIINIIILLLAIYVLRKKILAPIEYLHQAILAFRNNEKEIPKQKFYKDEIGQMIEQFFEMKEKIDQDNEKLRQLATTDPLTKIYNRRAFFEIANSFFTLAKREEIELSILILDIDFFKKVNDTYGHVAGDRILQHLAQVVQETLRKSDIFARYGGEEFIVLLPNTSLDAAQHVAQKIRQQVERTPCHIDDIDIFITISIGGSAYKKEDNSLNEIILRADKALYLAKENGRNRVEVL